MIATKLKIKNLVYRYFNNVYDLKQEFVPYYSTLEMHDKHLAFLGIFKCATTSVKNLLLKASNINVDDINSVNIRGRYFIDSSVKDFQKDSCFSFAFVRHPLSRVVSVWKDKLAENSEARLDLSRFGMYKGMTFENYINCLLKTSPLLIDRHLLPQSRYIFYENKLRVKYIGKLERFNEDWLVVSNQIASNVPLVRYNKTRKDNFEDYYTRNLRKKVVNYYQDDMQFFNYK